MYDWATQAMVQIADFIPVITQIGREFLFIWRDMNTDFWKQVIKGPFKQPILKRNLAKIWAIILYSVCS